MAPIKYNLFQAKFWPRLFGLCLKHLSPIKFRTAASAALVIMFALLSLRLWSFLCLATDTLKFPFQLDYGEGIVWQQTLMMFTHQAYGRIDDFPAIVFHYPPLYHMVTRGIAALTGGDILYTGRAISIGSTLLTAPVIGLIVARSAPANTSLITRLLAGACGALSIFCLEPVLIWGNIMRVDMLAFLLSFLGYWAGLKAFERPTYIYVAALCFVAAVYTKQTSISAPAALFSLMLWLRRPRLALGGIALCTIWGTVILALLTWVTDGGFIRHIFLYNINQFEWGGILMVLNWGVTKHVLIFWVALSWALKSISDRRIAELKIRCVGQPTQTATQIYADIAYFGILFYLVATTLMLVTIGKLGSSVNYLIEWLFTIVLLVGAAMFDVIRLAIEGKGDQMSNVRLGLCIATPIAIATQGLLSEGPNINIDKQQVPQLKALSARIRAADKPVISDDMVILLRSGKKVMWEPAIFAQLASVGVWDEGPFVKRIKNGELAMFITVNSDGDALFNGRFRPAIADAIDEAYPIKENLAGYTLHLPHQVDRSLFINKQSND